MRLFKKLLPCATAVSTLAVALSTTSCSSHSFSHWVNGRQISISAEKGVTDTRENITKLYIELNEKNNYEAFFKDVCHHLIENNNWIASTTSGIKVRYDGSLKFSNANIHWDDANKCVRLSLKYKWNVTTTTTNAASQSSTDVNRMTFTCHNICLCPMWVYTQEEKKSLTLPTVWYLFYDGTPASEAEIYANQLEHLQKDSSWYIDCNTFNHVGTDKETSERYYITSSNILLEHIDESYTKLPKIKKWFLAPCWSFTNMIRAE